MVLVAEAAKFARTGLAVIAPATAADILVTDAEAPEDAVAALRKAGVAVHRA